MDEKKKPGSTELSDAELKDVSWPTGTSKSQSTWIRLAPKLF